MNLEFFNFLSQICTKLTKIGPNFPILTKEGRSLVRVTSPRCLDLRPLNYFWYRCKTHAINKLRYVLWYGVVITSHTTFDHVASTIWCCCKGIIILLCVVLWWCCKLLIYVITTPRCAHTATHIHRPHTYNTLTHP